MLGVATFFDSRLGFAVAVAIGFFLVAMPSLLVLRKHLATRPLAAAPATLPMPDSALALHAEGAGAAPGKAVARMGTDVAARIEKTEAASAALLARYESERLIMLNMLHQQTLVTSITTATEVLAAMSENAVGHHLKNDDMRRAGYEGAVKLAVGKLRHMRGFDALVDVLRAAELNAENDFGQIDPGDFGDMPPAEVRRYRIAIDQWERVARYVREQREELVWELAGQVHVLRQAERQITSRDAS